MGIVTWCGATGAGDGVVNKVPEKQSDLRVNAKLQDTCSQQEGSYTH